MMAEFNDPRISNLTFDPDDGWAGTIELPLFAECDLSALDRANRKLAEQLRDGGEEFTDGPDEDQIDPAARTGFEIHIVNTGGGTITPAQQRTLSHLLDREQEILETILEAMFANYQSIFDDLREFHGQFDGGTLDDVVPAIDDSGELRELIAFGGIALGGDAVDGFVPVTFFGSCTWDEEHGFEIEILKDRAIGELDDNAFEPFPCALPEHVDLNSIPFDDAEECLVEFRIHGAWTGIYQLNSAGQVLQRTRPCLTCEGNCWDVEGIDAVRELPPAHRRMSSTPVLVATGLSVSGGSCFAPLLLILGLLAWPGFFWGALVFSAASVAAWSSFPALSQSRDWRMIAGSLVLSGLAIAGLVAWYQYDAFEKVSFAAAVGWIIWCGAALATLFAAVTGLGITVGLSRTVGRAGLVFSLPFLIFAAVVGIAVWKTSTDSFSKFHLLWIVPVSIYLALATGLSAGFAQLKLLGQQLDRTKPDSGGPQIVDTDAERKPNRKSDGDSGDHES